MSRQDLALFAELSGTLLCPRFDFIIFSPFHPVPGLMARGQQNYAIYRAEFGSTEPPHLPFLGVHLSDLVALDQLPTWLDPSGSGNAKQHVNFKKMRKLEQV